MHSINDKAIKLIANHRRSRGTDPACICMGGQTYKKYLGQDIEAGFRGAENLRTAKEIGGVPIVVVDDLDIGLGTGSIGG